jgi:hypothetical protein
MRIHYPALLAAYLSFSFCSGSYGQQSVLIPHDEPIAGASQEEWARRWWQWAWSFDYPESPVADRTGQFCGARQVGEVWYLAGTYGTRRTVRTCRVPAGKVIFFPLINYVVHPARGARENCMALMSRAAAMTETPSALVLELDGKQFEALASHRQVSKGCFNLNEAAASPSPPLLAAANGYYVALRPLAAGTHTLNFGGILPTMSQAVTYTLVAE